MKKIKVTWKNKKVKKDARVSSMYCFKNCEKNQNQDCSYRKFCGGSVAVCHAFFRYQEKRGLIVMNANQDVCEYEENERESDYESGRGHWKLLQ